MNNIRRNSCDVRIGAVTIGGDNSIAVQSMTNCDTNDTDTCVQQIRHIREAGGQIIRLTAQGRAEGENLACIMQRLDHESIDDVGIVADIHFVPEIAEIAARYVDKVRINPGNYRNDNGQFIRLLELCRKRNVSLRIGVNHGSLSQQIVNQWGDTPRGMVESAMEFLRICNSCKFDQVVVSMKSSNVRIMVYAYRLLVDTMDAECMNFPLHLGVTEAGNGMDGRVKSALGIGALLADGVGDTLRVSLTEPPQNEIPVGRELAQYFEEQWRQPINTTEIFKYNRLPSPYDYNKLLSEPVGRIGGTNMPIVYNELNDSELVAISKVKVHLLTAKCTTPVLEWRKAISELRASGDNRPVVLRRVYEDTDLKTLQLKAAADFGVMFVDGLADGIFIDCTHESFSSKEILNLSLSILQAARVRISKTEYIACPGCGRTLFNIENVLEQVKEQTAHLVGLKIAVMGCIVNGPGEMADADYGYVGAGRGKVSLYKGRNIMAKNIPENDAVNLFIGLINSDIQT